MNYIQKNLESKKYCVYTRKKELVHWKAQIAFQLLLQISLLSYLFITVSSCGLPDRLELLFSFNSSFTSLYTDTNSCHLCLYNSSVFPFSLLTALLPFGVPCFYLLCLDASLDYYYCSSLPTKKQARKLT